MEWVLQNETIAGYPFHSPWIDPVYISPGQCPFCGNTITQNVRLCPFCYALMENDCNNLIPINNNFPIAGVATLAATAFSSTLLCPVTFPFNIFIGGSLSLALWYAWLCPRQKTLSILNDENLDWLWQRTFHEKTTFKFRTQIYIEIDYSKQVDFKAYFEVLSLTQIDIEVLEIRGCNKIKVDFSLVQVTDKINQLKIINVEMNTLPASIWNVKDKLELKDIDGLMNLPEIENTSPHLNRLSLHIENCSIKGLPQTMGKRLFAEVHIKNCGGVDGLPRTLRAQVQSGVIQKINLEGTYVDEVFQKEIVLTYENRQTVAQDTRLFKDYDINCPKKSACFWYFSGIFVPLSIVSFAVDRLCGANVDPVKRVLFWITFFGVGAFSSSLLKKHGVPNTIEALIHKKGVEEIDGVIYDWDYLWRLIFIQKEEVIHPVPPRSLINFVDTWCGLMRKEFISALAMPMWQIIQKRAGGYTYLFAKKTLGEVLDDLEGWSKEGFGEIAQVIHDIRASLRCALIEMEAFISGGVSCNTGFLRPLFELISIQKNAVLKFDGLYYDQKTVISFEQFERFDKVYIKNAYLGCIHNSVWLVKHVVHLENCIVSLPMLSDSAAKLNPLCLELIGNDLSYLPDNLCLRRLKLLVLTYNRSLKMLPYDIKKRIDRISEIEVSQNGFKTLKTQYNKDDLKTSFVNEPIFYEKNGYYKDFGFAALGVVFGLCAVGLTQIKWPKKDNSVVWILLPLEPNDCVLSLVLQQIIEDESDAIILKVFFQALNDASYVKNEKIYTVSPQEILQLMRKKPFRIGYNNKFLRLAFQGDSRIIDIPLCNKSMIDVLKRYPYFFKKEVELSLGCYADLPNLNQKVDEFMLLLGFIKDGNKYIYPCLPSNSDNIVPLAS